MPRQAPNWGQNLLCSVVLPLLSLALLPVSLGAVVSCIVVDKALRLPRLRTESRISSPGPSSSGDCVIISGGRMTKGLTLARAFKRAGWKVIGVDEQGWGDLCAMRVSSAVDHFYTLPTASTSYDEYMAALTRIARAHRASLFIPVSGVASSVEDAKAAEEMFKATDGVCRTFIQDPETMLDLHEKDRFMDLVEKLGFTIPLGKRVGSLSETMSYLHERQAKGGKEKYVFKCMGIDENRGDMTLFPLDNDPTLSKTRKILETLPIRENNPYVFQEFIPGQEYCTHASVISGRITSFVTCPSNDMLMTYENVTQHAIGRRAEEWTKTFLNRLADDPTPSGKKRGLTGHFSFDFIVSETNGEMYPIECNARVHTAVIMLPLSRIAACYDDQTSKEILRPSPNTAPRTWFYNDLIMRYLPLFLPAHLLSKIHPSLPACVNIKPGIQPSEAPFRVRVEPTLVADDWKPFLMLWHVWWPYMLLSRWQQGKRWTRLNVSTGRIFEA